MCFGTGDQLRVIDIWKSQPEWDTFSETVAKVSQEVGIEVARIEIEPVQNIITP